MGRSLEGAEVRLVGLRGLPGMVGMVLGEGRDAGW